MLKFVDDIGSSDSTVKFLQITLSQKYVSLPGTNETNGRLA